MESPTKITEKQSLIIGKLLADILALLAFSLLIFLMAETALPGIISGKISLIKFSLLVLAAITATIYWNDRIGKDFPEIKKNGKDFNLLNLFLILTIFLMSLRTLFSASWWEISIILVVISYSLYLMRKVFFRY